MNKALSILLVVVIILGLIGGGAFFFFKSSTKTPISKVQEEEEVVKELPLEQKPYVSLTPRTDGHELHLLVSKIPSGTTAVEYDLFYTNADGINQGATGSGKTNGGTTLERDVLLGSCSSGKCKYDEGVEKGTFTLKLRDSNGKLTAKMQTEFHLQKNGGKLTSADGKFTLTSSNLSKTGYYLVMNTIGIPQNSPGNIASGPYGVFTKASIKVSGTVSLSGGTVYIFSTKWTPLESGKTSSLGTFISTQ